MLKKSFSLIELLVAISIITILAGMVIGGLNAVSEKSNVAQTKATIMLIEEAMFEYKKKNGEFPVTESKDMTSLTNTELQNLAIFGAKEVTDAWSNELYIIFPQDYSDTSAPGVYAMEYQIEGTSTRVFYNQNKFQIISKGEDGEINGAWNASQDDDNIGNF